MAQHFLLSTAARTLSLATVARMSDEEARETFKRVRWSDNGGEPYCPSCGCASVYGYKSRPIWKCEGCEHQFSVTSGTIFASRKLPLRDILLAIAIFANSAKGRRHHVNQYWDCPCCHVDRPSSVGGRVQQDSGWLRLLTDRHYRNGHGHGRGDCHSS